MKRKIKTTFIDMDGVRLKEGDILMRNFKTTAYEHPGRKRVAVNMIGQEVIATDYGKSWEEDAWIKRLIKWDGACLIAELVEKSENTDSIGWFEYLNSAFNSKEYKIIGSIYDKK